MSAFIKAYGLHWSWDEVAGKELWGSRGKTNKTHRLVNFWAQTGIYVLHDPWGAYYVGQVTGQPLGDRLNQHARKGTAANRNPHYGKWSHFSWFGFHSLLVPSKSTGITPVKTKAPDALLSNTAHTINDVEALMMMLLGTTRVGNKHSEKFTNAVPWEQVPLHELDSAKQRAEMQAQWVRFRGGSFPSQ